MKCKIKALKEQRNDKLIRMDEITNKAIEETRAMTEEEISEYDRLKGEVEALGETITRAESEYTEGLDPKEQKAEKEEKEEVRSFENYLRDMHAKMEQRADENFTKVGNGDVLSTRLSKKVIDTIKEHCNILQIANVIYANGTLEFPVYDESDGGITMGYSEEFTTSDATSGKFITKSLKGYLAKVITKISKSLINNTDFDLFGYVMTKVAEAAFDFIEHECIVGTPTKIKGLSEAEIAATAMTADGLIDLQDSIPKAYQKNARWLMTPKAKNKIRKLKDGQGNYLLERDYAKGDGSWTLLGKPVELTEADGFGDDKVVYGDFTGLYVKITEGASIQVLRETYAEQHAVGLLIWIEIDADLIEPQKIKVLKVGAAVDSEE